MCIFEPFHFYAFARLTINQCKIVSNINAEKLFVLFTRRSVFSKTMLAICDRWVPYVHDVTSVTKGLHKGSWLATVFTCSPSYSIIIIIYWLHVFEPKHYKNGFI